MNRQTATAIRVPLPGGSTAEVVSGQEHTLHADWLGSSRLSTTYIGRSLAYDVAYAPYGESYNASGSYTDDLDFTGQFADTLGHRFDFTYREYEPARGRDVGVNSPIANGICFIMRLPSNASAFRT